MFYNVEMFLDVPNKPSQCVWTDNATLPSDKIKRQFAVQTIGAYALKYANDFKLKFPSSIKDWFKIELTNDEGLIAATMRLILNPNPNQDGWMDKPTSDGLWFYVGKDGEGYEIIGVAIIELGNEFPIRDVLGYEESYQFGHECFGGPWKKINVPVPPGWTSDDNDIYTKNPMMLPKN